MFDIILSSFVIGWFGIGVVFAIWGYYIDFIKDSRCLYLSDIAMFPIVICLGPLMVLLLLHETTFANICREFWKFVCKMGNIRLNKRKKEN